MTGPSEVAPVSADGVQYEALHWGKEQGLGQNGGFVVARDAATGQQLWVQQIYEITYGDKSPQKYDLFITALTLIEGDAALRVTDQTGRIHRLDLATREVTLVIEPVTGPGRPHPEKPAVTERKSRLRRIFGG